jgi:hypothetical protein
MSLISSKLTATERIALKNKIITGITNKENNKEKRGTVNIGKLVTISNVVNPYSQENYSNNYPINYPLS